MSEKSEIRRLVRERISKLDATQRDAMSLSISERVFASPEYRSAHAVFFYHSLADEPDTRSMIDRALSEGKTVLLPRLEGMEMRLIRYTNETATSVNAYGIVEPIGENDPISPDLVILPLVAFDRDKHRLGRGKGYYDRFLSHYVGQTVGIAFSVQEVDCVPTERFDVSLQTIITEKECIR